MNPSRQTLTAFEVSRILGRSPAWFRRHRPDLEAAGFPRPLPVVNRYRAEAVTAWLDGAGGMGAKSQSAFEAGIERLRRGGGNQHPQA